jgi:pimeloyl-ACP methyl ester carboxylesterase
MHAAVVLAFATALSPSVELPTLFWGIEPTVVVVDADTRLKAKQARAVVLVHGLLPRVFHPDRAEKPEAHDWQVKDGRLVKALADEADVYGFSYAQTNGVDEVAYSRGLRDGIAAVKAAGYKEVVLVGHSCGAIICRRFAEAFPDAGVTKVVAVAGPFAGSGWAKLPGFTLPKTQVAFIQSLLPDAREAYLKDRDVTLPKDLQFCCVLCKAGRSDHDTVVNLRSQWSDDLQRQGVPAVVAACNHFEAMTCEVCTKEVAALVSGRVVRWDEEKTAQARRVLFGESRSEKR